MKKTIRLSGVCMLVLIFFSLSSCDEDNQNVPTIKQIRLQISDGTATFDTATAHSELFAYFNKNNYPGYDTMRLLVSGIQTYLGEPDSPDTIAPCIISLYDETDKKSIENSEIISDDTVAILSANFINSIPDGNINLPFT